MCNPSLGISHMSSLVVERQRSSTHFGHDLIDDRIPIGFILVEDRQAAIAAAGHVDQPRGSIEFQRVHSWTDRHRSDDAAVVAVNGRKDSAAAADEHALRRSPGCHHPAYRDRL